MGTVLSLEISTLGGLSILSAGAPVTRLKTRKVAALLVYLAGTGRPQLREALAEMFWEERSQKQAMSNLRGALSSLRKHLGPYLTIARDSVALNRDAGVYLDVAELEHRLEIGETEGAVNLYAGDFLAGFFIRGAPGFDDWVAIERERLRQLVLDALGELVAGHLDGGTYSEGIPHAQRLLRLDPLMEEGHRQLMRLLALNGQRRAALAQYETCCQVLEQELGVEPEAETTALHQRILAGQIAPTAEASAPPPYNLPAQDTPFVGREGALQEIGRLLEDPACRLLTLVGPGGSGKTRLALEAAARQLNANAYPDGIFFVSLAPLESTDAIVPTMAEALGITFYSGEGEGMAVGPQQQLLDFLRRRRLLLILDNYEHLLEGVGLVSDILKATAGVKVLVTSRAKLNLGGEQRYPVGGMAYPEVKAQAEGGFDEENYDAVKLFLQGAQRARPDFEPSDANLRGVIEICRLVEGMPLAIRLAAGWVEALPVSRIEDEIRRGLDLLETERRDVPPRQRSMRATLDHSWRMLSEREREVMQALSVFRGGFTPDAAQAIAGATLRELRALVNRSLLHTAPGGRYDAHELLRQYALEKLDASPGALDAARDRHCGFFAAALERWGEEMKGARQQTALAEMRTDRDNALAAWEWAAARGQVARLDQAVDGLCLLLERRSNLGDGEAACGAAAERLQAMVSDDARGPSQNAAETLRVLAEIVTWQGHFNVLMGRRDVAGPQLDHCLALLDSPRLADLDIRAEKAFALYAASLIPRYAGDLDRAQRLIEQGLMVARAVGDEWMAARLLVAAAAARVASGDLDDATRLTEESLALRRGLGDRWGEANCLGVLGGFARQRWALDESERLIRASVAIYGEIGHKGVESIGALNSLGLTLLWRGDYPEANAVAREALARAEDMGLVWPLPWLLTLRCAALMSLGAYTEVLSLARRCLTVAQETENRWGVAVALFHEGVVALVTTDYDEAQRLLEKAAAALRELGNRPDLSTVVAHLALAARGLGQHDLARPYVVEALCVAVEIDAVPCLLFALPAAALMFADAGEAERAVELYAVASRYDMVANSRRFDDVAGNQIAALAATLPPDVVAAAQERGRARDLRETAQELLEEF